MAIESSIMGMWLRTWKTTILKWFAANNQIINDFETSVRFSTDQLVGAVDDSLGNALGDAIESQYNYYEH